MLQNDLQLLKKETEICNSQYRRAARKNLKLRNFAILLLQEKLLKCKKVNCTTISHYYKSFGYAKRMVCSVNKIVIITDRSLHVIKKRYKRKRVSKRYAHLYSNCSKKWSPSVATKISCKIKQLQCYIVKLKNVIKFRKSFINSKREYFSTVCKALSVATDALQSANLQLNFDGMDMCQYNLDLLYNLPNTHQIS